MTPFRSSLLCFAHIFCCRFLSYLVLFYFVFLVMSCLVFFVFSCYALSYHHFSSLPCQVGQICIMIHSGSRGLGHQVATDALIAMETAMARDNLITNDRQLACARINSKVLRTTLHTTPQSTHNITQHTISRSKHHISALYTAHHASHYTAFYATLHISLHTPALHTAYCFPPSPCTIPTLPSSPHTIPPSVLNYPALH